MKVLQKCWRRRNASELISWGQHDPDIQTKDITHKKERKLQVNNSDEPKCKNPQQDGKQTEFNNTLKGLHNVIKWVFSQGCKDDSVFTSQSMCYSTLPKQKTKVPWSSQ